MYGTLTARLLAPRDDATLTVVLGGTSPALVNLPRKDGATKLAHQPLSSGMATRDFYLAFRVDRAAPLYPKPLDVGPEANGKVVPVKGAREVVIGLPGDKRSGCVWVVKSVTGDSPWGASVKPLGQVQFTPDVAPQMGIVISRAGIFENTFRVVGKGRSVVELEYKRTWQTGQPPEKAFRVTLDVQELPATAQTGP